MSTRVRLIYERRGGACFVPHVALISLFTRAALRAGLHLAVTQGFTPHPKMSFGPELPAGVVALGEPVDVWLEASPEELLCGADSIDGGIGGTRFADWSDAMPEGFRIVGASFPQEDSPSLGKVCREALYWIRPLGAMSCSQLADSARAFYGEHVLAADAGVRAEDDAQDEWLQLLLSAPAQNGMGGWVKSMIADGSLSGWHELNIVRAAIGSGDVVRCFALNAE